MECTDIFNFRYVTNIDKIVSLAVSLKRAQIFKGKFNICWGKLELTRTCISKINRG